MERGQEEPEDQPVAHQPPDSVDLRRHPPRDAVCLHVRGLLRDYADGDLEDAFRQAVDLHVHRCRECGLALARAEHEVFRLRRGSGPVVRTPEGFSGRTVQRLLVELSGAPADAEPVRQLAAAERGARFTGHRYLVGSMLLAAAILVAATVLFSAYSDVEARSGALMAKAIGVSWEAGGRIGTLGPGQTVPEGATIVVDEKGMAELLWRVQAGKRQPGAALRLHGGSKLEVHGDEPRLLRGTADVDVNRPLALDVGDAARLDLAVGVYHLDAAEFRSFDDALDGRGGSLRVRLETLQGEGTITRGSQAAVAVGQGQVAVWQGVTPIAVDSVPSETAVVMGLGGATRPTPRRIEPPGLVGYVVERPAARPTPGVPVILAYGRGGIAWSWSGTTDEHGMFQMPPGMQVDTGFVVAQVMPPPGRSDLGVCPSEIVPVVRSNAGVLLSEPLALDPSPAIEGTVRDEDQRPVVGARVVPCVIDELFGSMQPWVEGAVATDARGWFTLHSLPSRLSPYTRLGLILLHPEVASCCVPVPAPGTLAASQSQFQFQFTLEMLAPVIVQHLPPGQPVEFLEELPGTPAGSAVRVHQVNADLQGSAQLRIGAGQVWLKAGQPARQLLRHLVPVDPSSTNPPGNSQTGRILVPEEPVDSGSVMRTLSVVPGSNFQVARSFRGERFAATAPGAARAEPGMMPVFLGAIGELSGRVVQRAELYAVARATERSRPVARLLGLEDGSGSQAAALYGSEQTVVAMADDGSLGVIEVDSSRTRVLLSDPGSALLGEAARPRPEAPRQVVALRFTPRSPGLLPRIGAEFVRFACAAEGWQVHGVPPGDYEVAVVAPSGRSWIVTVVSSQIVTLH